MIDFLIEKICTKVEVQYSYGYERIARCQGVLEVVSREGIVVVDGKKFYVIPMSKVVCVQNYIETSNNSCDDDLK